MSAVLAENSGICSDEELRAALERMILSISGWRKIFAPDGEHGRLKTLSTADSCLAVAMGISWGRWLSENHGGSAVLVATDSRPTGPALSNFLIRGLRAARCKVIFIGIAAAPEAMAYCQKTRGIAGIAYISASHNPLGYNGVKFSTDGSVIGGLASAALIEKFRGLVRSEGAARYLMRLASKKFPGIEIDKRRKKSCLKTYARQLRLIAGGTENRAGRERLLRSLREALSEKPLAVVADLNGSARCLSADRMHIESLGAKFHSFNNMPGRIEHEILPEGRALEPCRRYLEELHGRDARLGYVPDNDGDRGNLVVWDDFSQGARILEAQEVFAIVTLAEFACAAWMGSSASRKDVLVVNGPTSHRVRPIAEAYGASVSEAEVGESNLVNLGRKLRGEGYRVRLLGEGSNGGVIVHPSRVRDPLNTVTALLKLLRLPKMPGVLNPFEDWCRRSSQSSLYRDDYGAADILASLPVFTTSSVSSEKSKMKVSCTEEGLLRTKWTDIFNLQWNIHAEGLRKIYDFHSWIQLNNRGMNSTQGPGPRDSNGGLKIVFRDKKQHDVGFLWMRGSKTEPVFRLIAEIKDARPEAEAALIAWHRAMVSEADRLATGAKSKEIPIPSPI